MALDQAILQSIADDLRNAGKSGTPIAPVRDALGGLTEADAYAIQSINSERSVSEGKRIAGRKVGLTSLVVQQQLGVDQPDFGCVYADLVFGDAEEIDPGLFIAPKAEAEITLVIGKDIDTPDPTVADIYAAVEYVLPSIEIVDSRIANWDIKFVDTVADNASFGATVLGGPARKIEGLDLRLCGMTLDLNGSQVATGLGAACLGHPLNAATWLARKLASFGTPLREGDIVMTGALGPMAAVKAGDAVEVNIDGLGSVRTFLGARS